MEFDHRAARRYICTIYQNLEKHRSNIKVNSGRFDLSEVISIPFLMNGGFVVAWVRKFRLGFSPVCFGLDPEVEADKEL